MLFSMQINKQLSFSLDVCIIFVPVRTFRYSISKLRVDNILTLNLGLLQDHLSLNC